MFKKNTAVTGFMLGFINATTGAPVTAGTPTGTFTLDGGVQAAIAGAFVHEGNGLWSVNLLAAEMNGTMVGLTFSLTNAINVFFTIKTVLIDPDDVVRAGLTSLPSSGTLAVNPILNATQTGVTIPTVTTLTGHTAQTGDNFARLGAPAGASVSADVAAVKSVIPAALVGGRIDASVGAIAANAITAAATAADFGAEVATAIWTDITAGDFTTALSVGKSVMNGVALGTGLTVAAVSGAAGSVTGAVGSVTGNVGGNVVGTVASVVGAVGSVAGLTAATVHADLDDIQARLPAALTAGGNIKADMLAISSSTVAADNLEESTEVIGTGTCAAGGATTTVIASTITPASAVNSQYNGRVIIFKGNTTAALAGQATTISSYVHATLTFTVVALTTAPASGDLFTIL